MSEPSNPWQVVEEWLPGNDEPERPQMNLATVSVTGEPDARTVLLSEYDSQGFYFHTDALSRKAAAIVANPAVALTFLWPGFTKQLVVQGRAAVAPADEIAAAYRARSPFLQQLAWQNTFEFAQYPDDERRDRWAAFTAAHTDGSAQPFFVQLSQKERQISYNRAGTQKDYMLRNTNELLGAEGVDGVKTGRTARAGDCLILSAQREAEVIKNGPTSATVIPRHLIVVLLGSPDRFVEGRGLLAQGWQLYEQWAAGGRMVDPKKVL